MDEPEDHTQDAPEVTPDDEDVDPGLLEETWDEPEPDPADEADADDVLAGEGSEEISDVTEGVDELVPDELTAEEAHDDDDPVDVDDVDLTEPVEELALPEVEPTGHPAVDAVLERLAGLRETSVHEHVAVFEEAHAALRRALDESGPQG